MSARAVRAIEKSLWVTCNVGGRIRASDTREGTRPRCEALRAQTLASPLPSPRTRPSRPLLPGPPLLIPLIASPSPQPRTLHQKPARCDKWSSLHSIRPYITRPDKSPPTVQCRLSRSSATFALYRLPPSIPSVPPRLHVGRLPVGSRKTGTAPAGRDPVSTCPPPHGPKSGRRAYKEVQENGQRAP